MSEAAAIRDEVRGRLLALWADLRSAASLRRRERRLSTYLLRLLCMALILVVLPAKKLIQLGPIDFMLAAVKVSLAGAVVVALLGAWFAAEAWSRRRRAAR